MTPTQSEEAFQALVLQYMPLVRTVSWRVHRLRGFDGIPIEDYIQFGAEGLMEALQRFDVKQGVKFETYASHRIRGAILSGLERVSEVNQQIATMRRVAQERLISLTGEEVDGVDGPDPDAAFSRLLDVSLGLAIAFMLDDTSLYAGVEKVHWGDGSANLAYKQLQERLRAALDRLTDSERTIINGHYFQHLSFDSVAQGLGVTRGRVSQLHRQALSKLRVGLKIQRLDELLG